MVARCLLALIMLATAAAGQEGRSDNRTEPAPPYLEAYHFTRDNFTSRINAGCMGISPRDSLVADG